ncbi:MAG TPA: MBL fold metallo-hydrolase [Verrucomicrobiota bacterium]|nr:MBL fold metallo-hydrolase [Verrucomicrobiota bacterium]
MPLEDHIGDIIRKARLHAAVSIESTAHAAGITPAQLEDLEQNGTLPNPIDFTRIANVLGLDSAKLERIARGWEPARVDTSRWRELRLIATNSAGFGVNCYLVWDSDTRMAALFDTGFDAVPVLRLLHENELHLRFVFITHGHHDHVAAWPQIQDAHPQAQRFPNTVSSDSAGAQVSFQLGNLRISARNTPGHAHDGITYIVTGWPDNAPAVAFVGDCLFAGSMGKAPGHAALAREKIITHILSLPPSTLICPGHGPLTTVSEELANNPFF